MLTTPTPLPQLPPWSPLLRCYPFSAIRKTRSSEDVQGSLPKNFLNAFYCRSQGTRIFCNTCLTGLACSCAGKTRSPVYYGEGSLSFPTRYPSSLAGIFDAVSFAAQKEGPFVSPSGAGTFFLVGIFFPPSVGFLESFLNLPVIGSCGSFFFLRTYGLDRQPPSLPCPASSLRPLTMVFLRITPAHAGGGDLLAVVALVPVSGSGSSSKGHTLWRFLLPPPL